MIKRISKSLAYMVMGMFSIIILSKCSPLLPSVPNPWQKPELIGVVNSESAAKFVSGLENAKEDNKKKKIYIKLDSFGGSVISGHSMITAMKKAQGQGFKLVCHVTKAGSMAFTILQYCDVRVGTDASIIMQHMTHDGNGRENMTFDTNEDRIQMSFFDRLHAIETSRKLGISYNAYLKRYRYSKWYIGLEACLDDVLDFVYIYKQQKVVSCKAYKKKYLELKQYLFKELKTPMRREVK